MKNKTFIVTALLSFTIPTTLSFAGEKFDHYTIETRADKSHQTLKQLCEMDRVAYLAKIENTAKGLSEFDIRAVGSSTSLREVEYDCRMVYGCKYYYVCGVNLVMTQPTFHFLKEVRRFQSKGLAQAYLNALAGNPAARILETGVSTVSVGRRQFAYDAISYSLIKD